jgi:hypothetical protein
VFTELHQLGGKTVRAPTLARNTLAITLKCAAYNLKRLVWLLENVSAWAPPRRQAANWHLARLRLHAANQRSWSIR